MPPQEQALIGDRLAAAVAHPTRMHAMSVFWEREASPREIATELGEPINNVTYHVNQLVNLGWIELVARRPARGGRVVEHFYKAIKGSQFDDAEWDNLGHKEKLLVDRTIMNLMSRDIAEAMLAGTFFATEDNHLTRIPIEVDAEGWEETKEILDRTLDELMEVRARSANRAAADGEETFPTKVEIIHFVSPEPKSGGDAAA
jgi:DNA-binding transcriptional ArsR family regulator